MDIVSRKTRSRVMAAVQSSNNKSTEKKMKAILAQCGIRGWKIGSSKLPGKPDFTFPAKHLAVFVDGCFWHGCPRCYRRPSTSRAYWDHKVVNNKRRDKKISKSLRSSGWKVIRIWEHDLKKSPNKAIMKVLDTINRNSSPIKKIS